ncbi:MAG: alkaline phosphatase family protein [Candidatus Aminicenantes bacterium]|nr:alkaline phosphatase family protein [Candidatus Aminicenantes bacterium]
MAALVRKSKANKACVIGLDGVPFSLLRELAERGVMPAAARLIAEGHLHRMRASLPEISAVSWTDFMTGTNAGEHGIFGFTDFKPGSYEVRYPNSLDVKRPPIWDVLAGKDRRSIVINQPSTYPARKINGILIAGFVAVDLARAVYPPAYKTVLDQLGYRVDIDSLKVRENPALLWEELAQAMAGGRKALKFFWTEAWDYFEFVVTGTDRLHHFAWDAYPDPSHPDHQKFLDYYRQVDGIIELIAASYRELSGTSEGLYMLSDHGFTGIFREVYLNAWLERHGYLSFARTDPAGLQDITPGTRAFALDPNRIYLNLKDRFPRGTVDRSERKALQREIAERVSGLEYEGRKVVRRVFFSEDVYRGPQSDRGPDLLILGENGFDMKGSVKKKEIFGRTDLRGMHTWDDAFFWADRECGQDLAIQDVARFILGNFS